VWRRCSHLCRRLLCCRLLQRNHRWRSHRPIGNHRPRNLLRSCSRHPMWGTSRCCSAKLLLLQFSFRMMRPSADVVLLLVQRASCNHEPQLRADLFLGAVRRLKLQQVALRLLALYLAGLLAEVNRLLSIGRRLVLHHIYPQPRVGSWVEARHRFRQSRALPRMLWLPQEAWLLEPFLPYSVQRHGSQEALVWNDLPRKLPEHLLHVIC